MRALTPTSVKLADWPAPSLPALQRADRLLRVAAACAVVLATCALCGCNSMSGHMNNRVGMWYYDQGNYVAAREQFQRAAIDEPLNASFVYNLAAAEKRSGDVAAAERSYVQAINADRSHQPSYHGLAVLLTEQGRQAEAIQMISSWAEAQPHNAGAQIELASLQHQNGDRIAAEQSLQRALAILPDDPVATAHLGGIYQELGQTERAAAMYRRSLQANWYQPQVQTRLATIQNSGGFNGDAGTMMASAPAGTWTAVTPGAVGAYAQAVSPERAVPPGAVGTLPTPVGQPVSAQLNDDPAHISVISGEPTRGEFH